MTRTYLAWRELAGTRFAPSRKQISPSRFKTVLGEVFLLDVINDGADFRFALGDDSLLRFLKGRLVPGTLLSAISGSHFHERVLRVFRRCFDTREPVAVGPSRATLQGREFLAVEALVLPLSDAGQSVTSLMGAIHTSVVEDYREAAKADRVL